MKKIGLYFGLISIILIAFSCKRDKEFIENTLVGNENFSQLKVGNYWIYQRFEIDANGMATPLNIFDSCYIQKDTVINSKTYFKKVVKSLPSQYNEVDYQRDSLNYLVSSSGQILFSAEDFSTIFLSFYETAGPNDTICQIIGKMVEKDQSVTVPAGTFVTSTMRLTYHFYPPWGNGTRYRPTRFAENVGIVVERIPFYVNNPKNIDRRLLRYHLN